MKDDENEFWAVAARKNARKYRGKTGGIWAKTTRSCQHRSESHRKGEVVVAALKFQISERNRRLLFTHLHIVHTCQHKYSQTVHECDYSWTGAFASTICTLQVFFMLIRGEWPAKMQTYLKAWYQRVHLPVHQNEGCHDRKTMTRTDTNSECWVSLRLFPHLWSPYPLAPGLTLKSLLFSCSDSGER